VRPRAGVIADRILRRPRVVYRGPVAREAVALTFDDGPSPWTAPIAQALERYGCRGTFFLLGTAVERDPTAVAALARAGHELGNHLWSHADPERQSRAQLRDEIKRTAAAIRRSSSLTPRVVRPPYCGAPRPVAAAARGIADLVVLRSVDPADWCAPSPEVIVEKVLHAIGPGDIVCLHDGIAPGNSGTDSRAATAAAVEELVPALLARGLRPVTVSELLA